ncbi:extracellular solute-binding protein [Micromonospora sp. NPDC126480]|uniref:ABC transporter substrate-binding protein n=1 Tax=Micromonospora sp. NPDC126480 TaxID=3155312 RepID=UPI0033332304
MMRIRSRLARAVAVGAALALIPPLAACGGDDAGGTPDQIRILVYGDGTNRVEAQIVETFNRTSKVKAVLETVPGADYEMRLRTIIDTDQAPDVFFNWGGGSIAPLVRAGLLLPLDDMIAKDPGLKDNFLPSVFDTAVVDGRAYGVPMRGTQPVLLFHNKKVLADNGLAPPRTWDDLLDAVDVLKARKITPIALGGGDQWPTQMWFQYLYDRVAGPELFRSALAGEKDVWASADSRRALDLLRQLTDAGAFGTSFDSVKFTDGGSPTLLASGRAGFELMGSWAYSTHHDANPEFARNDLGWTTFPRVPGGKGDRRNVAGNTNNFYSVHHRTRHPEAVAEFLKLMYSAEFVRAQLAIGNLPTTVDTGEFLDSAGNPAYARFQYDLVKRAPSFQLSWDQAYPPAATTTIHRAVQQYTNGRMDADGFIKAMQSLQAG